MIRVRNMTPKARSPSHDTGIKTTLMTDGTVPQEPFEPARGEFKTRRAEEGGRHLRAAQAGAGGAKN
jgi:hypothetical protein